MDTIESVVHYSNPEIIIVVDDTAGRGVNYAHPKLVTLPSAARGGHGGLWVNLAMAFSYAAQHAEFDVLLRLDTDALLLGPGIAAAAAGRFSEDPQVGALGAHRFGPSGDVRDWGPARDLLAAETGLLGLRNRARRRTLLSLVASAHGYEAGEHALGGAVLYRGETIREMRRRHLLNFPVLSESGLGEDHIFGLMTVVAGYKTADFSKPEDPMAVRWQGLPDSPDALLKAGKLVTHSIRSWGHLSEQEIRDYFAAVRAAD